MMCVLLSLRYLGNSGQITKIQTNHFRLETKPNWIIHKYHVDFNPQEDRTFIRKILLRDHRTRLGGHIFDGSTVFSINEITPPVSKQLEFACVK